MLSLGLIIVGIAACRAVCRERVRQIAREALAHSGISEKQLALNFDMHLGQLSRTLTEGTLQLADVLAFDEPVRQPIVLACNREIGIVTVPDFADVLRDVLIRFTRTGQLALPLATRDRRVA